MKRTGIQIGLPTVAIGLALALGAAQAAQIAGDPAAGFKAIALELSGARQSGAEESPANLERALAYIDSIALEAVNASPSPDLEIVNRRLAALASHTPPLGENYRLVKLGGAPAAYALAANFGLGGPAAVRVYAAQTAGRYGVAGRIDRYSQKDFFDSDVELVALAGNDPVFVSVAGRTDDLATGQFAAWKLDGGRLVALWNSDLLQQSSYESDDAGFRLAYCSQVDEDRPSNCLKMSRDLYRYQNGEWKKTESMEVAPPKPPSK